VAFFHDRGSRARLAILVLASVTALALDARDVTVLQDVRSAAVSVVGPFESAAERVSRPLRNAWHGITEYEDVKAEAEELRERLAANDASEIEESDARRQLEDLYETLDLPWAGDNEIEMVTARVSSGPRSNFSHAVEIDKGTGDGIEEGMPVVTVSGALAGRVSHAAHGRAMVELITRPEFQVGVRLAETGELGTARGQGRNEPLVVDSSMEPGTDVPDGTGLTTSGVDRSVYPEAIPVGRVTSTREGAGGLSLELLAEPLMEADRLSFLNVLIWTPPE
jgi:rod shape-determining protein MreC